MGTSVTDTLKMFDEVGKTVGAFNKSIAEVGSVFNNLKSVPETGAGSGAGAEAGAQAEGTSSPVAGMLEQFAVLKQVAGSIQQVMESGIIEQLTGMHKLITQTIPSWLKMNWQIALIGAAIGLVILFLDQFGISVADIINFASQLFTWLFEVINQGVMLVMPYVQMLWDLFLQALPIIGPLMLGLAAAFATYHGILTAVTLAQNAYTMVIKAYLFAVSLAQRAVIAFNMALAANPITVIVALIVGLIIAFFALIAAVQPVRQYVAETFRALGSIISKAVGWIIDMWTGFINGFIDGVNVFLSGINKVVNAVGSFLGIESSVNLELEKVDSSKFKAGVQKGIEDTFNASADFIEDFDGKKLLDKFGLSKFSGKGSTEGAAASGSTNPAIPVPAMDIPQPTDATNQWNAPARSTEISTVHEVSKVGSINDTVDVSSEDLKTMRELAELSSIQNFVTLTPTVQVQTGDITQEVDVNQMLRKIEQSMANEIASSAQGVYA